MRKRLLSLASVLAFLSINSHACSQLINNFESLGVYSARTMDFCIDLHSSLNLYPRGLKQGDLFADNNTMHWTNKYAYVSVNEPTMGKDITSEGLNEKGLSAHILYLDDAKHAPRNKKIVGINSFLWIHYILANYTTVDGVLKDINNYQIYTPALVLNGTSIVLPIHYSIEDASGDSAIIEFIDGKLKIYHGKQYKVMTNEPSLDKQLKNLAIIESSNNYNIGQLPGGADPANRFVRANYIANNMPSADNHNDAIAYMFTALNSLSVPYSNGYHNCGFDVSTTDSAVDAWPTQWGVVSDLSNRIMYFSNQKAGNRIYVDLKHADLTSNTIKSIDATDPKLFGDVTNLMK